MLETVPSTLFVLIASLFQFARPAVELSFLLQMIRMPPVAAASEATSPFATVRSSSVRKLVAKLCFSLSNSLLRSTASLFFLAGLLTGLLRGEPEGETLSSSSSSTEKRRLGLGVFRGEYWSFQSLMISWLQKASRLGRCGEGGTRIFGFVGDFNLGFEGLEGGVTSDS